MEKLKRTIKTLNTKEVQTKYGLKQKYNIQFEEEPDDDLNSEWADSFVGLWNKSWAVGDVIEFTPEQVGSREWKGKTYFTIGAPPEAKVGGGISREEFDALVDRVKTLEGNAIKNNGFTD